MWTNRRAWRLWIKKRCKASRCHKNIAEPLSKWNWTCHWMPPVLRDHILWPCEWGGHSRQFLLWLHGWSVDVHLTHCTCTSNNGEDSVACRDISSLSCDLIWLCSVSHQEWEVACITSSAMVEARVLITAIARRTSSNPSSILERLTRPPSLTVMKGWRRTLTSELRILFTELGFSETNSLELLYH